MEHGEKARKAGKARKGTMIADLSRLPFDKLRAGKAAPKPSGKSN